MIPKAVRATPDKDANGLIIWCDNPFPSTPPDQYTGDQQGNGNLNNGNNTWQDSLFLFVAIFFFFWLLSV